MTIAYILAGGSGFRMGGSIPKQFLEINGKEIWLYTVQTFHKISAIDKIVIVSHPNYIRHIEFAILSFNLNKIISIVPGGQERDQSAFYGLTNYRCAAEDKILICDAVRPCIQPKVIIDVINVLDTLLICDVGIPVIDTIFEVDNNCILNIPDRSRYALGQGPEGFHFGIVYEALQYHLAKKGERERITNISGIVKKYFPDITVGFVYGTPDNIKITTPQDLKIVELFIKGFEVQRNENPR